MRTLLIMPPGDFAVLERLPTEWLDENIVGAEIASALDKRSGDTMRRISRLVTIGAAQRRHGARGPVTSEVRRIAAVTE